MSEKDVPSGISAAQVSQLKEKALEAAKNAYAPYSHFYVGAALLLEGGEILAGCNVENASYRLTTCAEQNAVTSAAALYGPSVRIRAVVIVNLNGAASQPCGACRQTIHEFSTEATEVFFPASDGSFTRATIAQLLPYAFSLGNE